MKASRFVRWTVSAVLAAVLTLSCRKAPEKEVSDRPQTAGGEAKAPSGPAIPAPREGEKTIEAFEELKGWQTIVAPGTKLLLAQETGVEGRALRLDYDLGGTKAFVVASREVDLELPENFVFTFQVKRTAPENRFEFKLVDADGNTFMHNWYAFASLNRWKTMTVNRDQIRFAWGPNPNAPLKRIKKIEFTVAGTTGGGQVALDRLTLAPLARGAKPEPDPAVRARARFYPRWISDQQAYWTMIGVPGDDQEALIAEDGSLEPFKRGFALMPFLYADSRLVGREEAEVSQSLERGCLPIPSVHWDVQGLKMEVTAFAHGPSGGSTAYARYRISNDRKRSAQGKLFLAIHPYQIYPPWQGGGGISFIRSIRYVDGIVDVNEGSRMKLLSKPDGFGCQTEQGSEPEGNVVDFLERGALPPAREANDASGFASGAVEYAFDLKPGESADFYVCFPLHQSSAFPDDFPASDRMRGTFEKLRSETAAFWEKATDKFSIDIPDADLVQALRANIAYNLITLDGPAFQPGSRSYDKAWMRDGGSAANALLEMGFVSEPREFVEWFSTFQQPSGEIPPIIDTKEADPLWEEKQKGLIEYDSQGEFVWTVMQVYRFTGDRAFLERMFPKVVKALQFLEHLRSQRSTDDYRDGPADLRVFYNLLPASTSHEGYDRKHSYWDDFWALRGWRDGREMAEILGRKDLLPWMERQYAELKDGVYRSMALVMKTKKITFMPGCAELGDYDPTSSSVALTYCGEDQNVPSAWLKSTFDRYRDDVVNPRLPAKASYRYTPYEMRNLPALLKLGRTGEAKTLLRFLMDGRRPRAWQHFAEVVHSDPRFPTYIGDMPHTWVGGEFINAVRSLFLYEDGERLVIAQGIDEVWLSRPGGVAARDLPSWYGKVSFRMERKGREVHLSVSGDAAKAPAGGYVWKVPHANQIESIRLNGKAAAMNEAKEVVFRTLPAEITAAYREANAP